MTPAAPEKLQRDFFSNLDSQCRIDRLLDHTTGVYFFMKDLEGRIVAANQLTIDRCGCTDEKELIGKTDYDFFSYDLADKYVHDDKRVMEGGEPIIGMAELVHNDQGTLDFTFTNKIPLKDTKGNVIGMAGTAVGYELYLQSHQAYHPIAPAIRYIMEKYNEKLSIPDLAKRFNVSPRLFSEQFKELVTYTPQTFIVLVRLHFACCALTRTQKSIAEIAAESGFYDHSEFTRQFKRHMNESPRQYRKSYSVLTRGSEV